MQVTIQVFARLKDYFEEEIHLELKENSSIREIMHQLEMMNPDCRDILSVTKAAVNEHYVDLTHRLANNERVLLFPPSSGG